MFLLKSVTVVRAITATLFCQGIKDSVRVTYEEVCKSLELGTGTEFVIESLFCLCPNAHA